MPYSVTKNNVAYAVLEQMAARAFPRAAVSEIHELTEGYFNSSYRVALDGGRQVVLKVAPLPDADVMTYERDLMRSEVSSMRLAAERLDVPIPRILYYDNTHDICPSDYFFMEMLEGQSFSSCIDSMCEADINKVYYKVGEYTRKLNSIKNDRFGFFGLPESQGENWFGVFKNMLGYFYHDAERKGVVIPVSQQALTGLLERDRPIFEEVKQASFVHWDIWNGNVFVKAGEITGIIDFERCMWADCLMEVGFRTYGCHRPFLEGYGIEALDGSRQRRAKWYDIYLFMEMCLEGAYRRYDDDTMYLRGCRLLEEWTEGLR